MAKWLIIEDAVRTGEIDDAGGLRDSEEARAYVRELLGQYYRFRSEAVREAGGKLVGRPPCLGEALAGPTR